MTDSNLEPTHLELATIPQLGTFLVEKGMLTLDDQQKLWGALRTNQGKYVGQLIVELQLQNTQTGQAFTTQDISQVLVEQTALKAKAAARDIVTIKEKGTQEAPSWLKANWGNNGVNAAPAEITRAEGISAAANIAQNLTLYANAHPELALGFETAIVNANRLVDALSHGYSAAAPKEKVEEWLAGMTQALQQIPDPLPSSHSETPIAMNNFIIERGKEIRGALLALDQDLSKGPPGLAL
ncbi:MAG: hypothetical protein ACKVOE_00870 [Rickettsiales bacterium]